MTELSVYLPSELAITPEDLLEESNIPILPAAKIGSGVFHPDRLPFIPASKITGVLEEGNIPVAIPRGEDIGDAITAHEGETDPHPQYAKDEDLASGLAGKASTSHTHTGIPHVGSTAPSSPTIGDRWLDTGDRLVWWWNGIYWLSEQIHWFDAAFPTTINGSTFPGGFRPLPGYNLYLRSLTFTGTFLPGLYDSTNTWTVRLVRDAEGTAGNTPEATLSTLQTALIAQEVRGYSVTLNLHREVSALAIARIRIDVLKTNNPPNLNAVGARLTYQLAKP